MFAMLFTNAVVSLSSGALVTFDNIGMFESVQLDPDVSVVAFGVVEDTRCRDVELCFEDNRLIIAVLVTDGTDRKGYELELGQPLELANGSLELTGTSTPATGRWATDFKKYRLDFTYRAKR